MLEMNENENENENFIARLKKCYLVADMKMQERFRRSLPFADALFDRWERAEMLGFGKGASIYNSSLVFGDVKVGENVWIGPFTILDAHAEIIEIGDSCSISSGVHIYTHDSVIHALSGRKKPLQSSPVSIGECSYIGAQSIIGAGVSIGSHCVVGANSFVNRDVPPKTIVAGSPAKKIGVVTIDGDDIFLKYSDS
nr:acyltransferase [uncultured Pseudodesulfovibrio sp.]